MWKASLKRSCLLCAFELRQLPGNKIKGPIPTEIGNLSNLIHLNLENNLLSGQIPDVLGNLPKLQILYVFYVFIY